MKILTVELPREVVADIEAESRGRGISKSDVVRERLERAPAGIPGLLRLMRSPILLDLLKTCRPI